SALDAAHRAAPRADTERRHRHRLRQRLRARAALLHRLDRAAGRRDPARDSALRPWQRGARSAQRLRAPDAPLRAGARRAARARPVDCAPRSGRAAKTSPGRSVVESDRPIAKRALALLLCALLGPLSCVPAPLVTPAAGLAEYRVYGL